jgi:hypothetical protein
MTPRAFGLMPRRGTRQPLQVSPVLDALATSRSYKGYGDPEGYASSALLARGFLLLQAYATLRSRLLTALGLAAEPSRRASPSLPPCKRSPGPARERRHGSWSACRWRRRRPLAARLRRSPLPGPLWRPAPARYTPPTSRTGPRATLASAGAAKSCFGSFRFRREGDLRLFADAKHTRGGVMHRPRGTASVAQCE